MASSYVDEESFALVDASTLESCDGASIDREAKREGTALSDVGLKTSARLTLQDLQLVSLSAALRSSHVAPSNLTCLCLSGNAFEDSAELAAQLSSLQKLVELDLSRCCLTDLPEFPRMACLRSIDVSRNSLTSPRGISRCSALLRLSLARNRLQGTEQLEMLLQLEELDLSQNQLGPSVQSAMRTVAACTKLRILRVEGNPLAKDKSHRVLLASLFPSLVLLDERLVRPQRLPRESRSADPEKRKARSTPTTPAKVPASLREGVSYGMLAREKKVRPASSDPGRHPRRGAPHVQEVNGRPPRYARPTQSSKTAQGAARIDSRWSVEKAAGPGGSCFDRFVPPSRTSTRFSRPERDDARQEGRQIASATPVHERRVRATSQAASEHPVAERLRGKLQPQHFPEVPPLPGTSVPSAALEKSCGDGGRGLIEQQATETQASLLDILGEKRRLLQKVSGRFGEGVATSKFGAVASEPSATAASDELTQDLRSLCQSLRGGIERKRALLQQIQLI
eukprot:TRINITY_DN69300_c0_g1_i1.p1 TRINITY_DN69300_c0_g1~~TRINITY_DN69300_c0_g1_i1.p1  ORF type:complete len:511 (-),score=108.77 TRINITY_DN69300_c0_g1_i1:8-1540(-)